MGARHLLQSSQGEAALIATMLPGLYSVRLHVAGGRRHGTGTCRAIGTPVVPQNSKLPASILNSGPGLATFELEVCSLLPTDLWFWQGPRVPEALSLFFVSCVFFWFTETLFAALPCPIRIHDDTQPLCKRLRTTDNGRAPERGRCSQHEAVRLYCLQRRRAHRVPRIPSVEPS